MSWRSALVVVVLGVVLLLGFGAPAEGQTLDRIVTRYQLESSTWLERMLPVAQATFALLAALELAVSGILWGLRRTSFDQILGAAIPKFLLLSFLFTLISAFPLFLPYITRGFEWAGQTASGSSAVNPTEVLDLGIEISTEVLHALPAISGYHVVGIVVTTVSALLILLAYAAIAAQLVLVLVETTIVLSGGILFLGFAGFRGTAGFADNFLNWSFHVGIKIFLLYLLVGVGVSISHTWASELATAASRDVFAAVEEVLGGAIVFLLLTWKIPHTVASHLSSGATFRLQDALRAGSEG